jgi:hypothetical protein
MLGKFAEMVKGEAVNSLVGVARHCRELMHGARNPAVIEQLRLWMEELEEQAAMTARHLDDAGQDRSTPPCS